MQRLSDKAIKRIANDLRRYRRSKSFKWYPTGDGSYWYFQYNVPCGCGCKAVDTAFSARGFSPEEKDRIESLLSV